MSGLEGFGEHAEELRKRAVRAVLAVAIITTFILTFHIEPHQAAVGADGGTITLYYPAPQPLDNIAAQITGHLRDALVPDTVQLIQTAPGEAFFAQIYIAALVGVAASMPLIVREAAAFIRPALEEREIHVSRAISLPAIGLFATGCLFSYYMVVPYILDFLYRYGESAGLVTFLNVIDFVTFVLQFLIAFGISFQLPLAMYAATMSGMVSPDFWKRNARYAIVAIVIFGAVITPDGSGVTMWFIAAPMIALYAAGTAFIMRRARTQSASPDATV
ncbi:MAG: twin-arginine translocase subunit TatC [Thaumarchaeota archaeon]|nr:twin-arginine translocase subunit TatC [Nitrososphaerota archaeon]